MMIKPTDFWDKVARDVSIASNEMNSQVPLWDELDDLGRKSLVLICQLAVKAAARHGRAALPYDPDVA